MANIGIVFGTNNVDSQTVAEKIAANFDSDLLNAKELTIDFLNNHEKLIFVASTHKYGELQQDFKAKLDVVAEADLKGKTLALAGLGGLEKHPDTFCDGLVEFLPVIRGAKLVGAYENPGYKFENSLSLINGKFVGFVVDIHSDNEWEQKLGSWVSSIKSEF